MNTLTVPCEGIGVWEGARVRAQTLRYGEVCCTVVRRTIGMGAGWWDVVLDGLHIVSAHVGDMRLDLTHRPTRLEVIERWRVVTPRTTGGISGPWFSRMHRPNVQYLACGDLHAVARPVGRPSYLAYAVVVPALADLDPTDDTRLPDGARVVDVQALAIVLRQVFGVAR